MGCAWIMMACRARAFPFLRGYVLEVFLRKVKPNKPGLFHCPLDDAIHNATRDSNHCHAMQNIICPFGAPIVYMADLSKVASVHHQTVAKNSLRLDLGGLARVLSSIRLL